MDYHIPLYIGLGIFFVFIALIPSLGSIREIIRIHRTPTSFIGSIPTDGQVEIVGTSRNNITRSLLTNSDCVLWQVDISEYDPLSRGPQSTTLFSEMSQQAFEVSDGTGSVLVDPDMAKLILRDRFRKASSLLDPLDPHARQLIRKLVLRTESRVGLSRTLRVYERILRKEEPIYILGHIEIRDGHTMIVSKAGSPLVISDRSERELLGTLYSRVGANLLAIFALSFLVILFANI